MLGRRTAIGLLTLGALCGAASLAQAADPVTLWNFLGIPQGIRKIQGATINRRGNFPGLERKPPLKAIADPKNLESKNPAIKKAAEIKTEEDLAKQKIKALKYLATIGCGCYPGVKEALMAALDDCTEKVRYQAALAIAEAACNHCATCNNSCCCDEEMTKRLAEVAYERDDCGCFLEASERVREAAKDAMRACCASKPDRGGWPVDPEVPPVTDPGETPDTTPPGETPDTTPSGETPTNDPAPPPPAASTESPNLIFSSAANSEARTTPTTAMAEKVKVYRQRQPALQAAARGEQIGAKPVATPARVASTAQGVRPLELAEALAVLERVPGEEETLSAELDVTEAKAAATMPVVSQRPTPRYAQVTAVAEPQRTASAPVMK